MAVKKRSSRGGMAVEGGALPYYDSHSIIDQPVTPPTPEQVRNTRLALASSALRYEDDAASGLVCVMEALGLSDDAT